MIYRYYTPLRHHISGIKINDENIQYKFYKIMFCIRKYPKKALNFQNAISFKILSDRKIVFVNCISLKSILSISREL